MKIKWIAVLLIIISPLVWGDSTGKPSLVTNVPGASYILDLVLGLVVVSVAIVALAWLVKRMNKFQSPNGTCLKVVGGLSLSGRERLVLVEVAQTQILLGVAPGNVQTLHILGEQQDATFASKLQQVQTAVSDS